MPNCFTLTERGETSPSKLADIDAAICAHFLEECCPTAWYRGWYDIIGFSLAMGHTFAELRARFAGKDLSCQLEWSHGVEIVDFLDANYTSDAFYQFR